MTVVELFALAAVVGAAGWKGPPSFLRRYLVPLGAAVALPLGRRGAPIRSRDHRRAQRVVTLSTSAHPITAADYHDQLGAYYRRLAAVARAGDRQVLLMTSELQAPRPAEVPFVQPARSSLTIALAANVGAVGVTGYLSGPDVYVFDDYSLTNPIGSHFAVTHHGRPGHEEFIGPDWMIGRFGTRATALPSGVSRPSVTWARRALACDPRNFYLHAITAPLGFSQAISNIAHSLFFTLSFTTMTFSAAPGLAERELCH